LEDLRAQFPVLERLEYLNAGTTGPIPRAAHEAVLESLRAQVEQGRGGHAFFDRLMAQIDRLREEIGGLFGAPAEEVAITGSTTDGVNSIVAALDLGPGDEVLTSDQEHPGVLAPLGALRERRGVEIRIAPFDELAAAVGPRTRLVACSHVSWHTGQVVDAPALAATDALVLLDGAQGLGGVPVDVKALGCDFYAASGQKWLCGPNGLGYLYARAELAAELIPAWPGYGSLTDATRALELDLHPDTRRLNVGFPPPHHVDWALASVRVLGEAGWEAVHERSASLAAELAQRLGERVRPRGSSPLVAWTVDDPQAEVERLLQAGFLIRELPGQGTVRASVGAWTSEAALERLAALTC
jgi:L-cysteine/cystine lyase